MYEAELNMKFIFENSRKQINVKDAKIPFEYTIENLQNGESLNTNCDMGIKSQDFIIQDGGDISCNVDVQADTSMYRTANLNMIDSIVEDGEREEQDYSLVIYNLGNIPSQLNLHLYAFAFSLPSLVLSDTLFVVPNNSFSILSRFE